MSMKPTTLILAQTGAVTVEAEAQINNQDVPATIFATNLAGSESVAVLFSVDGGANFEPLAQDGADLVLVPTSNALTILSPGLYGFTKTATVGTGGVFLMTTNPKGAR